MGRAPGLFRLAVAELLPPAVGAIEHDLGRLVGLVVVAAVCASAFPAARTHTVTLHALDNGQRADVTADVGLFLAHHPTMGEIALVGHCPFG